MKNFKEKEIKDLTIIAGGLDPKVTNIRFKINFTLHLDGFFDGSLVNKNVNEFDKQENKPIITLN